MNLYLKHKIVIMRSLGACMLIIALTIEFWSVPKEGLSANERASARIARMEAGSQSKSTSQAKLTKKDSSDFLDTLKNTQAKQMQYLTILVMILGVGFLGYSFIPKKEDA